MTGLESVLGKLNIYVTGRKKEKGMVSILKGHLPEAAYTAYTESLLLERRWETQLHWEASTTEDGENYCRATDMICDWIVRWKER